MKHTIIETMSQLAAHLMREHEAGELTLSEDEFYMVDATLVTDLSSNNVGELLPSLAHLSDIALDHERSF